MNSESRFPSEIKMLRILMHSTPVTYQKRLALAHHLKGTGNNPNLNNRFGPLEQQAGEKLAETKFPLSPELKAQMQAGKFDLVTLSNTAVPTQPDYPVDERQQNEPLISEQKQAIANDHEEALASFPRSTPAVWSLEKRVNHMPNDLHSDEDGEEVDLPETIEEKAQGQAAFDQMRESFPRMTPRKASDTSTRNMPVAALSAIRVRSVRLISAGAVIAGLLAVAVFFLIEPPYVGVLSDLKATRSGVILDLDGHYPAEKMSVWVTKSACVQLYGHWPQVGTRLKVIGKRSSYRGRPEIVVNDSSQLVWQ
jgi:hypothetical protein